MKHNFKILQHHFVDPYGLFQMLLVLFWLVQNWGTISKNFVNMDDVTDCAMMFAIFGKNEIYY